MESAPDYSTRLRQLAAIGVALSSEKDHAKLLEVILLEAKEIANADGGTIYLRTKDDHLEFAIMRTDSLGIALGGTTGKAITLPRLPLYDAVTNEPNHHNVASYAALQGVSLNIPDAYHAAGFDFSSFFAGIFAHTAATPSLAAPSWNITATTASLPSLSA